jgi:sec-independent protein translocase protein TatA
MHLLLILVVVLVVFGPKRLPEIGKGLGEAIHGFKNTFNEATSDSVKPSEISKKEDERKTTH